MADAPLAEDERALRLTFTYRGDVIDLLDAQRLAMLVPPGDAMEEQGVRSGFWFELRDDAGGLVFRQGMHHPLASDMEVFPEDPAGEIIRQPVQERSGAFTLVIPEAAAAANLVLVASPSEPERRNLAATEVARFDMETLRRAADRYGRA